MTYALTRKEREQFDPAVRLGRPTIRSLFRIIAATPDMTDAAWQATLRPMIEVKRAAAEAMPLPHRDAAMRRLIEDCVLGLVALSNARMPGLTSRIPDLGILFRTTGDAAELRIAIGSDDAKAHAGYLADRLGSGLAALGLGVTACLTEAPSDHGWDLIWGMPDAVRWA